MLKSQGTVLVLERGLKILELLMLEKRPMASMRLQNIGESRRQRRIGSKRRWRQPAGAFRCWTINNSG